MYEELEIREALPEAASMIETFRAIGYSLETAVADIIDNSITAGANRIYINRIWDGGNSFITIKDNGCGMTDDELVHALRPGAQNPLIHRDEKDLGRFGLGLKTASFSQCRKLTVISKKNSEVSYWTWDLDYIAYCKKWNLIKWMPKNFKNSLDDLESGTIVIWSNLDRVVASNISKENQNAKEKFSNSLQNVREHLAMTFHRFIEDRQISIIWGSHEIKPWNPFFSTESKCQSFPVEHLQGDVRMRGYVLPHRNNFSSDFVYSSAKGLKGWNGQQGFYVYRGKRLLLSGNWLGLFQKEEAYKLARIMIDLPNSQDAEWQIDIKKSKAQPPVNIREQIEQYAKIVRSAAEEVFKHRGKILKQRSGQEFHPLWLEKMKDGKWSYVVNRKNPTISTIKNIASNSPDKAIEMLLKLIESNIPTKTIFINESKDEDVGQPMSSLDIDEVKSIILALYESFISQGKNPLTAKSTIKQIEPFNFYEDIIDNL